MRRTASKSVALGFRGQCLRRQCAQATELYGNQWDGGRDRGIHLFQNAFPIGPALLVKGTDVPFKRPIYRQLRLRATAFAVWLSVANSVAKEV
jgi:hypothetical protein